MAELVRTQDWSATPLGQAPLLEVVAQPVQEGSGLRVLVVEDNEEFGSFTRQSLVDWGFVATLAPDGVTALKARHRDRLGFDVAFSGFARDSGVGLQPCTGDGWVAWVRADRQAVLD